MLTVFDATGIAQNVFGSAQLEVFDAAGVLQGDLALASLPVHTHEDATQGGQLDKDALVIATAHALIGNDTAGAATAKEIAVSSALSLTAATLTIAANGVADTMLRDSAALSVIGRSGNSTGDPADIAAGAGTSYVLRESGSTLGFGLVELKTLESAAALSVIGRSANSIGAHADISTTAASGAVLRESGGTVGFGTIAAGGLADDSVTDAKLRNSGPLSVIGRAANTTGDPADISAVAASGSILRESGSTVGFGTADHGLALTGLSDDDHPVYALLAGRASGQNLKGGTAAADNLNLYSTAHGTPTGYVAVFAPFQMQPDAASYTGSGAFWRNTANLLKFYSAAEYTILAALTAGLANGDTFYWDGTHVVRVAAGSSGQFNKSAGAAAPTWASLAASDLTNGTIGYTLNAGDTTPAFEPHTIRHLRQWGFQSDLALGTGTRYGLTSAPTISGTVLNVDANAQPGIRTTTGAVSGNSAGVLSAFDICRIGWTPDISFRVTAGATITSYRHWIGLTSADLTGVGTPTTQSVAAFVYDTGVDGTVFWRTLTCDGASNVTRTATTVAVTASQTYTLRIYAASSTSIRFYIDNVLVNTHTTNTPAANAALGFQAAVTTLAAATRRQEWSRICGMSL